MGIAIAVAIAIASRGGGSLDAGSAFLTSSNSLISATGSVSVTGTAALVSSTSTASAIGVVVAFPNIGTNVLKLESWTGVTDSGGAISDWADTPHSQTFSQSSAGSKPTKVAGVFRGQPAIRFDGTNDFLTKGARLSGVRTIVVVFKSTTAATSPTSAFNAAANMVGDQSSSKVSGLGIQSTLAMGRLVGSSNYPNSGLSVINDGNAHVIAITTFNDDFIHYNLYIDGNLERSWVEDGGTDTIGLSCLGAGWKTDNTYTDAQDFFGGDIAGVYASSTVATEAQIIAAQPYWTALFGATTYVAAPTSQLKDLHGGLGWNCDLWSHRNLGNNTYVYWSSAYSLSAVGNLVDVDSTVPAINQRNSAANNKPSMILDGVSDFLQDYDGQALGPFSIFFVGKCTTNWLFYLGDSATTNELWLNPGENENYAVRYIKASPNQCAFQLGDNWGNANTFRIFSFISDGTFAGTNVYVNGVLKTKQGMQTTGNPGAAVTGTLTFGQYLTNYAAIEALHFSTATFAADTTTRQAAEARLAAFFGISI